MQGVGRERRNRYVLESMREGWTSQADVHPTIFRPDGFGASIGRVF